MQTLIPQNMAKILSAIAPTGFQDVEYKDSKIVLEEAGHEVVTACYEPIATGKFGAQVHADVLLDAVNQKDYDALLLVGGPGIYSYFDDPFLQALARDFLAAGKLTTAICAAPSVLANAGLLKGKRATCFAGERENLRAHGALLVDQGVEQDGLLITADGPESALKFGQKLAEALQREKK